jgi:hypothetical protein
MAAVEQERLIGHGDVQRVPVGFGVDGDAGEPGVPAGTDDPDRDLTAVGDQDLVHGALPPATARRSTTACQERGPAKLRHDHRARRGTGSPAAGAAATSSRTQASAAASSAGSGRPETTTTGSGGATGAGRGGAATALPVGAGRVGSRARLFMRG